MKERILSAIESPKDLEILYQQSPDEFQEAFPEIFNQLPDSIVLQVWYERLKYLHGTKDQPGFDTWSYKNLLLILLLAVIAGTLVRLPVVNYETIDPEWFYSRNIGGLFIIPLMIYFFFQRPQSRSTMFALFGIAAGALLFLNLLPFEYNGSSYEFRENFRKFADAIAVAELHLPLFLWLMLSVAFIGRNWKDNLSRITFLRYNGEVIVYTTIVIIGGMVLTGITLGLLTLLEESYELTEWYTRNIIPYGIAAAPLVSSFLIDKVIGRRLNIAPILARIFIPLFLVTTIAYLIIMFVYGQSPYDDREYLIAFNLLLIVVLGLLIFSIAEREPEKAVGLIDYMNLSLVVATLMIDLIALSAVVYRTANDIYGLTPNRMAILGINLLVFGHLVGILYHYARFATKKHTFLKLENWIAIYLPAYAIWAFVISVALPVIFWYR